MSDMKKWMKVMESVPPMLANGTDQSMKIKRDATVMVDPRVGGGTGRFMDYLPGGAKIDIKGVAVDLGDDDFALPERDYQEPYQSGNEWFHASKEPTTVGTMRDKPEFRPGDMVEIADVYGSVIGPGIGIFIAYSTTGNECIISFDDKEMLIPTENVGACLEQRAKDNFEEMDNDGNLSPMSLASQNVKIEQEPAMDQRDEFSKWLGAIEEAMSGEMDINMLPQSTGLCGCQDWKCGVCFPDETGQGGAIDTVVGDVEMGGESCPTCGHPCDNEHGGPSAGSIGTKAPQSFELGPQTGAMGMPQEINDIEFDQMATEEIPMGDDMPMDETDMEFEQEPERPKSGKGVKLGDIVQKYVPSGQGVDQSGEESPLTYGEDNLAEVTDDFSMDDQEPDYDADPMAQRELGQFQADANEFASASDQDIEGMEEMAGKITYMQDMGLSKSSRVYSEHDFATMSPSQLNQAYQEVTGNAAIDQGQPTMENVDKDVAAMLNSLKKYDTLVESVSPVLGMVTLNAKRAPAKLAEESDDDKLPAFLRKGKADGKEATDKRNEKTGADVWKNPRDGKKEKKEDVKESTDQADQEVLDWMARFSKLGNMKGYGR